MNIFSLKEQLVTNLAKTYQHIVERISKKYFIREATLVLRRQQQYTQEERRSTRLARVEGRPTPFQWSRGAVRNYRT